MGKIISSEEHGRTVKLVEKDQAIIRAANVTNYVSARNSINWHKEETSFTWKATGHLNLAHEAVDRWVSEGKGEEIAVRIVGEGFAQELTFQMLQDQSNQFANFLRQIGVQKGDRVFILLPYSAECFAAYFGTLKVGAIVGTLFDTFTSDSIAQRMKDAQAVVLVTLPAYKKRVPYPILDQLKHVVLVGDDGDREFYGDAQVYAWEEEVASASTECQVEWVDAEDPAILHYTTRPKETAKGIVLPHRAMTFMRYTAKTVLDLKDGDVIWVTFDVGHIAGVVYEIIAPLLCGGVKIVAYRGKVDANLWVQVIQNENVTVWYTSPTALRLIMTAGPQTLQKYQISSLRLIFSVGEPLSEDLIDWSLREPPEGLGLPVHDTFWMTETGGITIANFPSMKIKIGSIGVPVPGVKATVLGEKGEELPPYEVGTLVMESGWPGMFTGVWGDEAIFNHYFRCDPWFSTIDHAYVDNGGYFWLKTIETACFGDGQEVTPFEIEQKLLEHPGVAEVGVVGIMDESLGNIIKAFIKPSDLPVEDVEQFKEELMTLVANKCGADWAPKEIIVLPFTTPDGTVVEELPKTASGKMMRRILQDWATPK
ncbi:MAG TPA: AMP-binding protein [Candidatus Lokiarchaeia archaeon]|nr:AMP-binding protein [Candidatus Lokiarchaeia archaeon]